MTQRKKDLKYGNKKENSLLPLLNKCYNTDLSKTKPFYEFDFIDNDKKILIELKSRRNGKYEYTSSMVGANKIVKGLEKIKEGYKVIFIFGFTDSVSAFELTETNINENWYMEGGRKDRGKDEIKLYCYIPNEKLINLFSKNKNDSIYTMSDQTQMTEDQKPLSFSKRLINHISSDGKKSYKVSEIESLINAFSSMEYEKKKEKSDEIPFGKYKFKKVTDVAKFDPQYLKWLVKQDMLDNWTELKNEIIKNLKV
jgi:hypothetical protein